MRAFPFSLGGHLNGLVASGDKKDPSEDGRKNSPESGTLWCFGWIADVSLLRSWHPLGFWNSRYTPQGILWRWLRGGGFSQGTTRLTRNRIAVPLLSSGRVSGKSSDSSMLPLSFPDSKVLIGTVLRDQGSSRGCRVDRPAWVCTLICYD
jgi:hypothetical protein